MSKGGVTEGTHSHIDAYMDMHTHMQACRQGTGQPIRPPQAPSRPLNRALMGCGIDRPSVTVSRWITVSGREAQKREGEERRREGRGERRRKRRRGETEGSNPLLLQESLSLSFSQRQVLILEEKT